MYKKSHLQRFAIGEGYSRSSELPLLDLEKEINCILQRT